MIILNTMANLRKNNNFNDSFRVSFEIILFIFEKLNFFSCFFDFVFFSKYKVI